MAEESRFSKNPRIAWGPPTSDSNKAKKLSKLPQARSYLSESPDIYTNFTETSEATPCAQSSLDKSHSTSPLAHSTPRLTWSPKQGKLYHGFEKQKSTAPVKLSQARNLPSLVLTACKSTLKEPLTYPKSRSRTEKRAVVTNLAQVVPVNYSMDSGEEKTVQVLAI